MDWNLGFILAFCFGLLWYLASFLTVFFDLRRGDARVVTRNPSFPANSFVTGVYSSGVIISYCGDCTINMNQMGWYSAH